MNGAVYRFCCILESVVVSAAEAEIVALFPNTKEGKILCIALNELGHK